MASHPRPPLSRLNIPGSQSFNIQQPIVFDPRGQSMFSPALPTAIQQGFHPPFSMNGPSALHTPMQPLFPPQPPGAPGRPSYVQHRGGQASIAQLAAVGIHPPNGIPMTPLGHGFPGSGVPFGVNGPTLVPRNRRTPSMSLGGPPKAVLGGPNRKVSPLPPAAAELTPAIPTAKGKKVIVKFPRETVVGDEPAQSITRPLWARTPLADVPEQRMPEPPQLTTAEPYLSDSERYDLPSTLDVFLPGKAAWDSLRKLDIEEKLQKLGVEPGSGSSVVHIHAPHGRAASISSPADSALLYFKLNKLQQSQATSSSNSLSSSPQPPFNLSSSPNNQLPPRMQNRHGHAMSLAQPPTHQSSIYSSTFNPFSSSVPFGDSPGPVAPENIHAPQGRVPVTASSLALPPSSSRPDSRPDFARGFGLDVPEEEEEPEEFVVVATDVSQEVNGLVATDNAAIDQQAGDEVADQDGMTTVAQSTLHSRHVSNALSVGSVRGVLNPPVIEWPGMEPLRSHAVNPDMDDLDQDAIGEWTGSEDLHHSDMSDDEGSIGEWSNPSDEERARKERIQLRRVKREMEGPRRIPNFPRPPENTIVGGILPEDDIISNPSEEDHVPTGGRRGYLGIGSAEYCNRPSSVESSSRNRPLPRPPHSRGTSGQLSISEHDPALAHSRAPSQPFVFPGATRALSQTLTGGNVPTLNPNAKPFLFGAASQSGSWASGAFGGTSTPPNPAPAQPTFGHSRMPSLGKPLNAAAQEFRPGGFTFRPPPAAPQMAFPAPESSRPLPMPPASARAMQGREKRQRRVSHDSFDGEDEDGRSNMSSFRFPSTTESPRAVRRSAPTTPRILSSRRQSSPNPPAQPFTFNGFSSVPADTSIPLPHSQVPCIEDPTGGINDCGTPEIEGGELSPRGLPIPPSAKQKRAPIPLDFTNPTHSNTVPAGLFKAAANGDERTRGTVRSRRDMREAVEHTHRPSVGDLTGPSISRKASRLGLAEQALSPEPEVSGDVKDFFSPAVQRRSSFPGTTSPLSDISFPTANLTKRFESQHLEQRLEALFDEKIEIIRREASSKQSDSFNDARVNEVLSLFKTQLERDAARGLQEGQMDMDARGEIDFEVIRDVIQEGHTNATALIQQELANVIQRLEAAGRQPSDLLSVLERHNDNTIQAVVGAVGRMSTRMETSQNNHLLSEFEREALLRDFISILGPMISNLRSEEVDYDVLTQRLSQAVKPHISQLIDLTSDKRETASLIVDGIKPLLPSPRSSPFLETEAIAAQLTSEIRKAIAPIDAHEIKEQVADLVVERLDSRLAVRDKTFNVDSVAAKITEGVVCSLEPMRQAVTAVGTLIESQKALTSQNDELACSHRNLVALLSDLPAKLDAATETMDLAKTEFLSRPEIAKPDTEYSEIISRIESTVNNLTGGQKAISLQTNELLAVHQDVISRLSALPESLSAATSVLQNAHAEFASSRDASKHDLDEIRRLKTQNAEIQVQLAKARGAHGQVRVEKDNLVEKIGIVESDRDRYRSQLEELQSSFAAQAINTAAVESRNSELEEALSQALAGLKTSDVAAQTYQERITGLEKANREVTLQNQSLKSKADTLDVQVTAAIRDRDAAIEAKKALQKEHDHVISQQTHWDDLHRAAEQIEMLTTLIGQADNEEVKELKRIRDRSNKLEGEHSALQKRFRDQESKVANSERAAAIARQSLAQAQQRASEWERRAKDYEGELEMTRTKLDQADQIHAQLDADYSLAKLQLEEREADDRLTKDRENNLHNQVTTLEALVARLEADLTKAKAAAAAPFIPSAHHNGYTPSPPRPDSRTNTAYGVSRSGTPVARMNGSSIRSHTPPQSSVWDSMHAPKLAPSYPRLPLATSTVRNPSHHTEIPSPTPSTISLAPTQGDDGWWR